MTNAPLEAVGLLKVLAKAGTVEILCALEESGSRMSGNDLMYGLKRQVSEPLKACLAAGLIRDTSREGAIPRAYEVTPKGLKALEVARSLARMEVEEAGQVQP